jgi:hypothetical protein
MLTINLDASGWKTVLDFYDAMLKALKSPKGHGRSVNALLDSMVWGGMNDVEPPYVVRISGLSGAPRDVVDEVNLVKVEMADSREEFRKREGHDVEVSIETLP